MVALVLKGGIDHDALSKPHVDAARAPHASRPPPDR